MGSTDVKINFKHLCADGSTKEWTHEFNVKKGATIRQLKMVMVEPEGTKEDAEKFELKRNGRRVKDFTQVWQPSVFDFEYLGAEVGQKKAKRDQMVEDGEADEIIDLSGTWKFVEKNGPNEADYTFFHEVDADTFNGFQTGIGWIHETSLRKDVISWSVGDFKARGKLEDNGRTITDLRVTMGGRNLGTYSGRRTYPASAWQCHPQYDLKNKADVETMKCDPDSKEQVENVKRRVETKGWTGFCIWNKHAYIKGAGKPLVKEDLEFGGDECTTVFYLFNPPDPHEEYAKAASAFENAKSQSEEQNKSKESEKPKEEPKPQPKPAPKKEAQQVEVTVRHSQEEHQSQITVTVSSDCRVVDVRRAIMEALNESKLSEIKLVKKSGRSFATLDNEERIGDRREFLSMGRRLEKTGGAAPAAAPAAPKPAPKAEERKPAPAASAPKSSGPITLKITSIVDETEVDVTVSESATVKELKTKVCDQVKRGPVSKCKIHLYDLFGDELGKELDDGAAIQSLSDGQRATLRISEISLGPAKSVEVKVTHGAAEHSVIVSVQDTCTIADVRRAVANKLGARTTDVRMVKKLGGSGAGGWSSLGETDRLNGRQELFCMGSALEKPPPAAKGGAAPAPAAAPASAPAPAEDKMLTYMIYIDRGMDFKAPIEARKGVNPGDLKQILAAMDPTGNAKADEFDLWLPASNGKPETKLPDGLPLGEDHLELDLRPRV